MADRERISSGTVSGFTACVDMEEKVSVKKAISELIGCTRRKRRLKSIIEITDIIEFLHKELGTYRAVAERVGLSTEMLREFRSVRLLDPEVRELVEKRVIDSVDLVYRISKLDPKTQKAVVDKVLKDQMTGDDARVVKSLVVGRKGSGKAAILQTMKSRDIKTYLIQFRMPKERTSCQLRGDFSKIIGGREIVSFKFEKGMAVLELSYRGQKELRIAAKRRKKTLRKFVADLLTK